AMVSKPGPVAPRQRHPRTGDAHFFPVVRQRFQHCRPCGNCGAGRKWPGLHHRGQRGRPGAAQLIFYRLWRNQGVRCAGYRLERMMTIKLRDYLRLHPNQGVELLTEFGYYTLTKQEIKTQLRKHGAVRSVTGRPLSFDTLLEQEVLDEQPGDPPLLRTGRKERRDEPC